MSAININYIYNEPGYAIDNISIHNPVNLLFEVDYDTIVPPTGITLTFYGENEIGTFSVKLVECNPLIYSTNTNTRTFILRDTNEILKPFMESYNDTLSVEKSINHLPNMTKLIKMNMVCDSITEIVYINLMHCSTQVHGELLTMETFSGEITYCGGEESVVYVYFYNNSNDNVITISGGGIIPVLEFVALDYDDAPFKDFDDYYFRIDIE